MTTPTNKRITVQLEEAGTRLDRFLVEKLDQQFSRSKIQKWITKGWVTVNEQQVTKHHFLDNGDLVYIQAEEEERVWSTDQAQEIPVLYEDDDLLVIEKPTGVLVHPTEQSTEWTLAHFVQSVVPEITTVGDDPQRPGIVHRLDRLVSGIMVVAKTQHAFEHLKQQFKDRTVTKRYQAIVHDVPSKEHDILKFKIARSKTKSGKMAARPEDAEGKDAWTEYDVVRTKNDRYAELAVSIKTGRTHQIRAHLAAINHPVVGDTLYATHQDHHKKEYPRLFLHAKRLEITHPTTEERMVWEAPIPASFSEFLGD